MSNSNAISIGAASGSTPSLPNETEAIQQTELSRQQKEKWDSTTAMMAWTAPGFRHIWYKMLAAQHNASKSDYVAVMSKTVPIAATDGKNLILNPDKFFEFSLPERVFIAAHEVVHNVYGDVELLHRVQKSGSVPMHDGTALPFDNPTIQRAMDLRIDALLVDSKIGKPPQTSIDRLAEHGVDIKNKAQVQAMAQRSMLDIYQETYKKKPDDDGDQEGEGPGDNPGGFDQLLPPGAASGQNPAQAAQQRNPGQWAVEAAAAQTIEQMKSQGKMAGALQRLFAEILEPEVPWVDHIETLITRALGGGSHNWKQPDEWYIGRDIYQPKKSGLGAGWIVVWGDTSGSRDDKEIASNLAELASILDDVAPRRLTVIWCDAAIDYIDEVDDPLDLAKIKSRGTAGGGGTAVQPVYDWMVEQNMDTPDLFIGFTDGYVTFPREPAFPVIWASSTDQPYPYGQVVRVNKQKRAVP